MQKLPIQKLSIERIIEKIDAGEKFSALTLSGGFLVTVEEYVPYICYAIHNGGNFRSELREKLNLTKMDRWVEEDPFTWRFIESLPIRVVVYDSRYEYDLNRSPDDALYETAWGKDVWKTPLTEEERENSLNKHRDFYRVVDALVGKLESEFGSSMIYDIHSYNYKRDKRNIDSFPTFNLGTEKIDSKFNKYTARFLRELAKIDLSPLHNRVAENEVFFGRGYLLSHITEKFNNSLVFAIEVKKIYVDEESGDEYPDIIEKIRFGLKRAILNTSYYFVKQSKIKNFNKKYELLSSISEDKLKIIDQQLSQLLKGVDILKHVNPTNLTSEKKRFLASKSYQPNFRYKPVTINTKELKRELFRVPLDQINDITLKHLYSSIVEESVKKIELLESINTPNFLYNSIRIFGRPDEMDLANAKYLLHLAPFEDEDEMISSEESVEMIKEIVKSYGLKCTVKTSKNISANAMVLNTSRTVLLKAGEIFSKRYAEALGHHEAGIHILTTINASKEPLKILHSGTPNNTKSQEGLAVLNEYLSGNLTLDRLRELAIRVIAVDLAVRGRDFRTIFEKLQSDYNISSDKSFQITTRVLRGGGFTKDALYLKGFIELLKKYRKGDSLEALLIGKTSVEYIETLNELITRGVLKSPVHTPETLFKKVESDKILDYILEGLK